MGKTTTLFESIFIFILLEEYSLIKKLTKFDNCIPKLFLISEKTCKLIADKINLSGSINIQLRKKGERVAIFEINPRFSSTVKFRHMMGFEDVIWSIQDKLEMSIDTYHINHSINKFYKGFSEYVN